MLRKPFLFFTFNLMISTASVLMEEKLMMDLFGNRTKVMPFVRPKRDYTSTLNVSVGLILFQIVDVDEVYQNVCLIMCFYMTWFDETLFWDPISYQGIQTIRVPKSYVWYPDIHLYNTADTKYEVPFETTIGINYNGTMDYMPPAIGRSTCKIDIKWFPFDEQICWLRYASWTLQKNMILLEVNDKVTSSELWFDNGEWMLLNWTANQTNKYYECCPENPWSEITFTLKIRRRSLFYIVNVLMPTLLITFLSLLGFLLPPESGEKIELGMTAFMSLMVLLVVVSESIPHTSESVPLIGVYFSCIMFTISSSIMLTILVLRFHHHASVKPLGPLMRQIFFGRLPRLLWLDTSSLQRRTTHRRHSQPRDSMVVFSERSLRSVPDNLRHYSAYSIPFIDEEEKPNGTIGRGQIPIPARAARNHYCPTERSQSPILLNRYESETSAILMSILREMRSFSNKIKRDDEKAANLNEWKFVAQVLDRLLFVIFVLCVCGLTIFLFCSAPIS